MPSCQVKNTGDSPLCLTDPDSGQVYCVLPGYSCKAKTEWLDVREALRGGRAIVTSGTASDKK